MKTLTLPLRRQIYNSIIALGDFLGKYASTDSFNELNIVDFLNQIWNLSTMPSEDSRFSNAEADAIQHLINNDDWDLDFTFVTRFNLLGGNELYFVKFLELVVSPTTRLDRKEIMRYVEVINDGLKIVRCELALAGFIDGLPQYRFSYKLSDVCKHPNDFLPNSIPIFVNKETAYPSFLLKKSVWDDYGYKTRYELYYCSQKNEYNYIGQIRILNEKSCCTYDLLPNKIFGLEKTFVSLGQTPRYYEQIKKFIGEESYSFLYAMRDVACFPKFRERIEKTFGYTHSLTRYEEAKQALRMGQYLLAGYKLEDNINFIFKVQLPYNPTTLNIRFNFGRLYETNSFSRIIALIGDNGVGKTTVLSKIAQSIVDNVKENFLPHPPLFSKILATSYSIFDNFFKNTQSSYNYQYCGIQKASGEIMDDKEIAERRFTSLKMIADYDRLEDLKKIMHSILGDDLLQSILDSNEQISENLISQQYKRLSSGQSMLMNLTIEMLAHIRSNTLILIDEPEVHLHPKGITFIVQFIDWICERYSSCCIMSTHSALIIQELMSKNVIVLDREFDGTPFVKSMRNECLGENLTTITEDVFGRRVESPLYMKKLERLAKNRVSIEQAIQMIQNNDVPLNMHLYLLLDKYLHHEKHDS